MKKLVLILPLLALTACAAANPVPNDIKAAVAAIPENELQAYPAKEQEKCRGKQNISKTRTSKEMCVIKVRRDEAEKRMMEK